MAGEIREKVSGLGEGQKVDFFGITITVRVSSTDSAGDFVVWEEVAPPGFSPPRHLHREMDQSFEVIEGHYRVWCDGRTHEVGPGGMVLVPKGMAHSFICLGPDHGRMLTTTVPGGIDEFMIEIESRGFKLPDDMAELIELGKRHGHEFVGPPLKL